MSRLLKNFAHIVIISFCFAVASCQSGGSEDLTQDTVFLESGVKYVYLNKGSGLQVDTGSHVTTHINLMVNGDTVWSTLAPGEQLFEFDAQRTSLIKGFAEVVMYAKEGDRILAIIPSELGYGERGTGDDIPPNSTLYFDLDFLKVEVPKMFLSDVILDVLENDGIDELDAALEKIGNDTVQYNLSVAEWPAAHRKLMNEGKFNLSVDMWNYRLANEKEAAAFYYLAQAYDSLGQKDEAMSTLKSGMEEFSGNRDTEFLRNYMEELQKR